MKLQLATPSFQTDNWADSSLPTLPTKFAKVAIGRRAFIKLVHGNLFVSSQWGASFWGPGRKIEECLPSWQFKNWELTVYLETGSCQLQLWQLSWQSWTWAFLDPPVFKINWHYKVGKVGIVWMLKTPVSNPSFILNFFDSDWGQSWELSDGTLDQRLWETSLMIRVLYKMASLLFLWV